MVLSGHDTFTLPDKEKIYIKQQILKRPEFSKAVVRASGPAKLKSDKWGTVGESHDFLCDGSKIDRYGAIVGFGAHMPLFLKLHPLSRKGASEEQSRNAQASGSGDKSGGGWSGGGSDAWKDDARASGHGTKRQRSEVGKELRAVKFEKYQEWRRTHSWPWHLAYHPAEATYFAPKNFKEGGTYHEGGGHDGVAWRLTRPKYINEGRQQELDEYEAKWIQQYGLQAHRRALHFTEPFFVLAEEKGHTVDQVLSDPDIAAEYRKMAGGLDLVDYDTDPYEV